MPIARSLDVDGAIEALRAGRLALLPTETVYGLGARADRPEAVAAIYAAKGRPRFNPLIAHVAGVNAAARIGVLDARAQALADRFWPGPLTIVVPVRPAGDVCELARAGLDTVALRAPAHPVAQAVLGGLGLPVVAPSANRSGRPSPTRFADAVEETGNAAAAWLDGGDCAVGLESTVVALLPGEPARLLRAGGVARAALERVAGPLAAAEADDARRSPGRLALHYAPDAPVRLDAATPRAGEAFLAFGPPPPGCDPARVLRLSDAGDVREAAARLFSALRDADRLRPSAIAVAPIPDTDLGEAINDRLRRAAGYVG